MSREDKQEEAFQWVNLHHKVLLWNGFTILSYSRAGSSLVCISSANTSQSSRFAVLLLSEFGGHTVYALLPSGSHMCEARKYYYFFFLARWKDIRNYIYYCTLTWRAKMHETLFLRLNYHIWREGSESSVWLLGSPKDPPSWPMFFPAPHNCSYYT